MKKTMRKLVPGDVWYKLFKIKETKRLKKEFKLDYEKYKENSFTFSNKINKRHLEGDLVFYYHKFEKGLSLPKPRVGFGKKNIKYLLDAIKKYVYLYGWEELPVISLNTLNIYYEFNKKNGLDMKDLYKEITQLKVKIPDNSKTSKGGIFELSKAEIEKNNINFKDFAYSRYSIRDFSNEKVDIKKIEKAVEIALKTPSVCNRQPSKVYVFSEHKDKSAILKYQNGNAGFSDSIEKILIVTTNINDFRGVIERNQLYIEGGLFSMSLMYGLHAQGLGTCPLNLSIINEVENKLRKVANIPSSEVPIMMIAVGHLPEKINVACSPRRSVEETMVIH